MAADLPLFPLGTVLYPGLKLPLHVFEDRYRALVADLMRADEADRRFGVVAIRAGHEVGSESVQALYDVGCATVVTRIDAYDDGRYDLLTTGTARFRLVDVDRGGAYLRGQVEWLDEQVGDAARAAEAATGVRALFPRYVDRVLTARGGDPPPRRELPDEPLLLSYLVAAAMVLDLGDRQRLLAADDAVARLEAEAQLLRREAAVVGRLQAVPAVDLTRGSVSPN